MSLESLLWQQGELMVCKRTHVVGKHLAYRGRLQQDTTSFVVAKILLSFSFLLSSYHREPDLLATRQREKRIPLQELSITLLSRVLSGLFLLNVNVKINFDEVKPHSRRVKV